MLIYAHVEQGLWWEEISMHPSQNFAVYFMQRSPNSICIPYCRYSMLDVGSREVDGIANFYFEIKWKLIFRNALFKDRSMLFRVSTRISVSLYPFWIPSISKFKKYTFRKTKNMANKLR